MLRLILLGSAALSLLWVFRVPIYQSPDEPAHLDYGLSIYQRRGLFRPEEAPLVPYQNGWVYHGHPYTPYLLDRAETMRLAFNPDAKVGLDYGTASYYRSLDREAPMPLANQVQAPVLAPMYPCGYYTFLALWIGLIRAWSDSLVVTFFGARILSVLLLVGSLALVYGTARELQLSERFALLLTALIGFFPLTSFLSSYVQPDNLSFTLVSLCFYLALRARRGPGIGAALGLLGLALGALLMTKAHHYACVLLPVVAMLLTREPGRPNSRKCLLVMLVLLLPSALLVGLSYPWTAWGGGYLQRELTARSGSALLEVLPRIGQAVVDYFAGTTHESFWGVFGWMDTPLRFRGHRTNALVRFVLQACAWILLALTLIRLEQVLSRLFVLARRGHSRRALRLAFANPVLNSYFLFTLLMIWLYVRSNNQFAAQGRNWFPFILPAFLTGLVYAPRALSLRHTRRLCSTALTAGLVLYTILGSYYALKTITHRYYPPDAQVPVRETSVSVVPASMSQVYWNEDGCEGNGEDPQVVFALPKAEFVYGIRLKVEVAHAGEMPIALQLFWRDSERNEFCGSERQSLFHLPSWKSEWTLTVWIKDTIDQVRIDPDVRPCRFRINEVTLLQPARE